MGTRQDWWFNIQTILESLSQGSQGLANDLEETKNNIVTLLDAQQRARDYIKTIRDYSKHTRDNSLALKNTQLRIEKDIDKLLGFEKTSRNHLSTIEDRTLIPMYYDISLYPVTEDLTSDGNQYEAEVSTTTAGVDVTLFEYTFNPPIGGSILWIYFLVGAAFKAATSATADIIWKAQARDLGGTWVDLFSAVTYANIGLTYLDKKMEGYFKVVANFNEVPFDFRIIYQSDELNEGRGKPKNNTIIRVVYELEP